MYKDSISFPTILQEEGYKLPVITNNVPSPLNATEVDEWTSFDINPFSSDQEFTIGPIPLPSCHFQLSSSPLVPPPSSASPTNGSLDQASSPSHRVHEILSTTTSQDNVSVSSPASVVQFLQMVDRCPSYKSDGNHNNHIETFDTKCSF
jgi:hypothetical protein